MTSGFVEKSPESRHMPNTFSETKILGRFGKLGERKRASEQRKRLGAPQLPLGCDCEVRKRKGLAKAPLEWLPGRR